MKTNKQDIKKIKYSEYLTDSPFKTKELGKIFSKKILKFSSKKTAVIIGLQGNLGSGKTCFLQGFACGLKIKEKINSPTFVIMKKFQISRPPLASSQANDRQTSFKFQNFYHIDCYRINKPKELLLLDFKKIISEPQNIIAIEWANQIKKILPKKIITIKFTFIDKNKRKIKFLF